MKSERRHELQHNALANWLAETFETVRPYGNTIVGVVAVIVLVCAGWLWWTRQSAVDRSAAWNDLFMAQLSGDPAKLTDLSDKYPGSSAADWASVVAGDMYLASGCDKLFGNKATAADELKKAVESYRKALQQNDTPMLRQRATYGLARAYEAMSGTRQSELDKAIRTYGDLVKKWPDGIFAKAGQQRLDDLKQSATKKFYDQFAKYDPKPAFTEETGKAGQQLRFDSSALPEPKSLSPSAGSTTPEPAKSGLTPDAIPPAGQPAQPPAAEKPAASQQPAQSEHVPGAPPATQ